ncbi:hypothetical protein SprV_0502032000 [Sparganum proliferum]
MCRSLYFEDKPEYSYLRRLLRALFKRHHFTHDIVFDWNLLKISGTEGAGGGGANGTGGGSGGVNANGEKQNNNSNNNNNSNPNAGALVPTAGGSGGGQKVIAPAALALAVYQDQRQQQADVDCSDVQQKGKSRHHFPNAVSYGYVPPNQTAGLKSQPQPPASLEDAIERADRFVEVEKSRAANAQNWRPTPHRPQTPNTSNFTSHRFGHNFNNGNRYRPPHPHYQPRYNQPKDDQRPQCQCGVRPWQPEDRRSPQKPGSVYIPICSVPFDEPSFFIDISVGNKSVRALIDTGATLSLVNPRILTHTLLERIQKYGSLPTLVAANGSPLECSGIVHISLQFEHSCKDHDFLVVPDLTWYLLLGIDFLNKYDCCINVRKRAVSFGEIKDAEKMNDPFDEAVVCAKISAVVSLPPTNIDDILKDHTDMDAGHKESLRSLLLSFHDVFAWDESQIGRTSFIRHTIETGNAKPVWQPPRRIPAHLQAEVNDLLDKMLKAGIIKTLSFTLGVSSHSSTKEGWQTTVLCGLQTIEYPHR